MNKNKTSKIYWAYIYWPVISFLIGGLITYGFMKGDDILGLVGSIIGVLGAYYISSNESRKQKKSESEYAIDMLCCLLNSTVKDTEYVIPTFIDKSKYYWEYRIYKPYLENIDNFHLKKEAKIFLNNVGQNFYTDEHILFFFLSVMSQPRFNNLINRFNNDVNRYFNFDGIIYDDNWYNHLKFIDDEEKVYRKQIINWIKLIKGANIQVSNDETEKGNYLDIYKFMILRDDIIEFLKVHNYGGYELYKEIYKSQIHSKG